MKREFLREMDRELGPPPPVESMSLEQLKAAASYGEPAAFAALDHRMQEDPTIWREGGNPTRQLLAKLLDALESENVIHYQLTLRFVDELGSQLASPDASALERIMGERVLLAYVNLHLVHAKQLSLDEPQLSQCPFFKIDGLRPMQTSPTKGLNHLRGLKRKPCPDRTLSHVRASVVLNYFSFNRVNSLVYA
jgi:hypothetical protein